MNIVFVTNYYNHHQAAMAQYMDIQTKHSFTFIETEPMTIERKSMGWSNDHAPSFVRKSYISKQESVECQRLINDADVVIWGSCPFRMIRPRLKARKLTFCYSERLFKKGFGLIAFGSRAIKYWLKHCRYQENHYLLCASAYAASDYAILGLFRNRAYKWGYFPKCAETRKCEEIISQKQPASILWAGRMLAWKHPEIALQIAHRLKQAGVPFEMNIIGDGECFETVRDACRKLELEEQVHLLGVKSPEVVRQYMEKSDIYLFTSDYNEGWGAVVNEAMSSACAVVASDAAGSVRYLINNGYNGISCSHDHLDEMYLNVEMLLKNRAACLRYGSRAFATIGTEWSAQVAVDRFCTFVRGLREGTVVQWNAGPCSKAKQ